MALDRYGDVLPRSILKPRSAGDGNPVYVALSFADEPDLVRLQDAMRQSGIKAEWQEPGLFHCSLLILEDATDEQLAGLLEDLSLPVRFWVEVASLGTFEADDIPLIANVVASPGLIRLQQEFAAAALRMHLPVFEFFRVTAWKPHITLGYDSDANIEELPPIPAIIKLRAEAVLLMRDDYNVVRRILLPETMPDRAFIEAGGKGSGFYGHAGRPGEVGGSLPSSEVAEEVTPQVVDRPCPRCGGTGFIPQFQHVEGGICFDCGGTGLVPGVEGEVYSGTGERIMPPGRVLDFSEWIRRNLPPEAGPIIQPTHGKVVRYVGTWQDGQLYEMQLEVGNIRFMMRTGPYWYKFNTEEGITRILPNETVGIDPDLWTLDDAVIAVVAPLVTTRNAERMQPILRDIEREERRRDQQRRRASGLQERGGPGSGFFGHAGRPGEVGGSLPSGEVAEETESITVGRNPWESTYHRPDGTLDMEAIGRDVARAVAERPSRESHGRTSVNAFFLVNGRIYSWDQWQTIPPDEMSQAIGVHSHSADNWQQYRQMHNEGKPETFAPLNSADIALMFRNFMLHRMGPASIIIMGDGRMESLEILPDTDGRALRMREARLSPILHRDYADRSAYHDAHRDDPNYDTNQQERELLHQFASQYGLGYQVGHWRDDPLGQPSITRHYGPGTHPGTGTDQSVHAGGATSPNKNGQLDGSLAAIERQYPEVEEGERVDGREVRGPASNWDSVSASLAQWESLPGYRIVRMSQFTDLDPNEPPGFYSRELRESTEELARAIKTGQWIEPLIVAVDDKGPWVIEGSHRFDALRILKAKAFPAIVVIDREALPDPDVVQRHYGPGLHAGTGTPQSAHAGAGANLKGGPRSGGIVSGAELYAYQNHEIEHLPKELGHRIYGSDLEGAGDIFREITLHADSRISPYGSRSYVEEKLHRLESDLEHYPWEALPALGSTDPDYDLAEEIGRRFRRLGILADPTMEAARQLNLAIAARNMTAIRGRIGEIRRLLNMAAVPPGGAATLAERHYGPGPHPGTGTPQSVHGGGSISGEARLVSGIGPRRAHSRARYKPVIVADGIAALATMPQTQTWQPVWEGLEAIDRVHRMPDYMPDLLQRTPKPGQLPFERSRSEIRTGGYWQLNGDGAKKIGVDLEETGGYAADPSHPQLTTVHEVGHFLDNVLFGDPQTGGMATMGKGARVGRPPGMVETLDQQFEDVIATIRESVDYRDLCGQNLQFFTVEGIAGQHFEYPWRAAMRVRSPVEMFARGYSQWIALRSGNSTMRTQIDYRNELADRGAPRLQWRWDNFEPIAGAYDRLFRAAGLLRSTP